MTTESITPKDVEKLPPDLSVFKTTRAEQPIGDDGLPFDGEMPYRTLSKGAVVALILALLGQPLVWLFVQGDSIFWAVIWLPIIAAFLGAVSLIKIIRYPRELVGKVPAVLSLLVAVPTVVASISLFTYIYVTEVPDGYQRISWYDLKPDRGSQLPIPQEAFAMHGKKVFITAYVHPSVSGSGPVKKCMLVGDMGTCCFGGMPKLTDQIDAQFEGDLSIRYNQQTRKLAGTLLLDINPRDPRTLYKPADGSGGGYYILRVDKIVR